MADFGVGEAAAAEGAKSAAETDAAITAAEAGSASEGASLYAGSGALADTAGAGLTAELGGTAVAPEIASTLSTVPGGVGLAPGSDSLATSANATGAPEIASTIQPVSAPGNLPVDASSIAGDTGLAPPPGSTEVADVIPPATAPTATNAEVSNAITNAEGGNSSIGSKLLDQLSNNKATAAALGLNAFSAYNANQRGKDAASQLKGAAAPFNDTGKDLLAQYKSGKLNPGDEFNINQWEQQQIAAVASQYGGNSTAARNAKGQIEARAQAMREQARKGLLDEGLKAMGMGTPLLTAAVQQQTQQDHALQQSQASALNSLMLLQALQARGTG